MSQTHEFTVEMTCEGCSNAVKRVLDKHKDKGIDKVDISLEAKTVAVTTSLTADDVMEIIKKTGKETKFVKST